MGGDIGTIQLLVWLGDLDEVKNFLRDNKNFIKEVDGNKEYRNLSLLHIAAECGHEDIAKELIIQGSKVNEVDICQKEDGWNWSDLAYNYDRCPRVTPLHLARNKEIVSLLVSSGAEVNVKSDFGTPLHVAAYNGLSDVVEALISSQEGVNIDEIRQIRRNGRNPVPERTPLLDALFGFHENGYRAVSFDVPHIIHKNLYWNSRKLHFKGEVTTWGTIVDEYEKKRHRLSDHSFDGLTKILTRLLKGGADANFRSIRYKPIERGYYYDYSEPEYVTPLDLIYELNDKLSMREMLSLFNLVVEYGGDIGYALHRTFNANTSPEKPEDESIRTMLMSEFKNKIAQSQLVPVFLHNAAKIGDIKLLQWLLDNVSDPDAWAEDIEYTRSVDVHQIEATYPGFHMCGTPLAWSDSVETAQLLINNGADPEKGLLNVQRSDVARYLIDLVLVNANGNLNVIEKRGITPLLYALYRRSCGRKDEPNRLAGHDIAHLLINAGANVNIKDEYGYTPLYLACHPLNDHIVDVDLVASILERMSSAEGAGLNGGRFRFFGPYHDYEFVEAGHVTTPLHVALGNKQEKVIELLLSNGANPNVTTDRDLCSYFGPRNLAAIYYCWNAEILRLFLSYRADIAVQDSNGFTLIHSDFYTEVDMLKLVLDKDITLLNSRDAKKRTPLFHAISRRNLSKVEFLLSYRNIDLQAVDQFGNTLLHFGVKYNMPANILTVFIRAGVSLNSQNKHGTSPLHLARNPDTILMLLSAGADIEHKDKMGRTPLFYYSGLVECYETEFQVGDIGCGWFSYFPDIEAVKTVITEKRVDIDVQLHDCTGGLPHLVGTDYICDWSDKNCEFYSQKNDLLFDGATILSLIIFRISHTNADDHETLIELLHLLTTTQGRNLDGAVEYFKTKMTKENRARSLVKTTSAASCHSGFFEQTLNYLQTHLISYMNEYDEIDKHSERIRVALQTSETISYSRSKLMLVGRGGVGKTSTVRSLLDEPFDENWKSTQLASVEKSIVLEKYSTKEWKEKDSRDNLLHGDMKEYARLVMLTPKSEPNNNRFSNGSSSRRRKLGVYRLSQSRQNLTSHHRQITGSLVAKSRKTNDIPMASLSKRDIIYKFDNVLVVNESSPENRDNVFRKSGPSIAETIKFTIWDFGGQNVFHSIHHVFLTDNGVYLVVFNMENLVDVKAKTEEIDSLVYWIRSIKLHAPNSPIMLVGTHWRSAKGKEDQVNKILCQPELELHVNDQVWPNESSDILFYPLENDGMEGISRIRVAVKEVCQAGDRFAGIRKIREPIKLYWLYIMDFLMGQEKEKMSMDEVTEKVLRYSVPESELIDILRHFHELGCILYFSKHKLLRKTVTFQPQWLIDAFSCLIFDPLTHRKRTLEIQRQSKELVGFNKSFLKTAIIRKELMDYLWSKYSDAEKEFLKALMQHMMLLSPYNFVSDGIEFLIPTMLQESKINAPAYNVDRLDIEFSVGAPLDDTLLLPDGIFERIICLCVTESCRYEGSRRPDISKNRALLSFGYCLEFKLEVLAEEKLIMLATKGLFGNTRKYLPELVSFLDVSIQRLVSEVIGENVKYRLRLFPRDIKKNAWVAYDTVEDALEANRKIIRAEVLEEQIKLESFAHWFPMKKSKDTVRKLSGIIQKGFDCFLAHDWGIDNKTHDRVDSIRTLLEERGLRTWFDQKDMHHDIKISMADGIEKSKCVIIFITRRYSNRLEFKVNNCTKEFEFAIGNKDMDKGEVIPVILDKSMLNPKEWGKRLSMGLSPHSTMHINMTTPESVEKSIDGLVKRIENIERQS